jgi:CheY-like chemotaxis protein
MADNPVEEQRGVKTILLVEDDVNIGEVLLQVIAQETPYIAVLAPSGSEALQVIHNVKPNLFILDYQLPQMNGIALYDQLHASPELVNVRAIMISAHLPQKDISSRPGIFGLPKPIDLDEFLNTIEKLIT